MPIQKDQIYQTLRDIDVVCLTSWRAPYTGSYQRVLPAGERFKIWSTPVATATATYCLPLRYRALHKTMVPFSDRWQFWLYAGYYLSIQLDDIEKCQYFSG